MSKTYTNQNWNIRRKKRPKKADQSSANSTVLHRQTIMPLKFKSNLTYVDSSMVRNNPGNSYLVWGMRLNDLFDPDPAILSGSISGFKELMQFYSRYRVNANHVEVAVSNLEAFPLVWGLVFTDINVLGTIPTAAAALNLLENGYTTGARILSAKGGQDRDTQVVNINLPELVGNPTVYLGDLDYTGTISTSPVISLWCFVVIVSSTGAVLSNGVTNQSKFTYKSSFFDRNILLA